MYPGIGLTTIYRTLELLHRLGLVHRVAAGDGQAAIRSKEKTKRPSPPPYCTKCGRIVDYRDFLKEELELVKKTEEALARKHNFAITDHNIEFFGLCEKCR
jgi:Fur family ferric uptake transcriptional regulator